MRICFLTTGLERGKEGIGDYCRELATELQHQGHQVLIMALKDSHLEPARNVKVFTHTQPTETEPLIYLRLSDRLSVSKRSAEAMKFIKDFNPDYISVQFGFDWFGKGWLGLRSLCRKLSRNRKRHLHLHDIWYGPKPPNSLFEKISLTFREFQLKQFIAKFRPDSIHTHSLTLQQIMHRKGYKINNIPLFSNVPVKNKNQSDWIFDLFQRNGLLLTPENRNEYYVFTVFGKFFHVFNPATFMAKFVPALNSSGRKGVIIYAGNLQGDAKNIWETIELESGQNIYPIHAGHLTLDELSDILAFSDYGLSTYPPALLDKSGTVAAFIEHGLPIIEANDYNPPQLIGLKRPQHPLFVDFKQIETFNQYGKMPSIAGARSRIVGQFVDDLLIIGKLI